MTITIESAGLAAPLADLKAYLRIATDEEDNVLADMIRAAGDVAERFTGQMLIGRGVTQVLDAAPDWRPLAMRPVTAITALAGIPASGAPFALPVDAYALDIDGDGTGWVRVGDAGAARRIQVSYQAGLAADPAGVPDAIRHGIIRLAGDYHALREGVEPQPPASVAALWRPWRRMRLA
jgi:uncharacterized phiE125 gp8 family phage protein